MHFLWNDNLKSTLAIREQAFTWAMLTQICLTIWHRADSRFAPSQWETALLCNDVSHWRGASLESALMASQGHHDLKSFSLWWNTPDIYWLLHKHTLMWQNQNKIGPMPAAIMWQSWDRIESWCSWHRVNSGLILADNGMFTWLMLITPVNVTCSLR